MGVDVEVAELDVSSSASVNRAIEADRRIDRSPRRRGQQRRHRVVRRRPPRLRRRGEPPARHQRARRRARRRGPWCRTWFVRAGERSSTSGRSPARSVCRTQGCTRRASTPSRRSPRRCTSSSPTSASGWRSSNRGSSRPGCPGTPSSPRRCRRTRLSTPVGRRSAAGCDSSSAASPPMPQLVADVIYEAATSDRAAAAVAGRRRRLARARRQDGPVVRGLRGGDAHHPRLARVTRAAEPVSRPLGPAPSSTAAGSSPVRCRTDRPTKRLNPVATNG